MRYAKARHRARQLEMRAQHAARKNDGAFQWLNVPERQHVKTQWLPTLPPLTPPWHGVEEAKAT